MEDPTARRVWDTALGQLQLQVTPPNYETWLKGTVGLSAGNGCFVIGTPSDFHSEWLSARMGPVIAKAVSGILGHDVALRFQVAPQAANGNGAGAELLAAASATPSPEPSPNAKRTLNGKFTFDRFVVGDCNHLAAAAALSAADQPGEVYNPLFIYGGSGLGKTHLLQAIAHRCYRGDRRVLYTTSEQFTNDFVTAIAQGRQDEFRGKYRSLHLLLVDDVQFLADKERTQEEFFHTFNDLHAGGSQLVVTADAPPKTVPGLQNRLSSRFQWGLIADVQAPDDATRLAILRAKAIEQRIEISAEVAQLLAERARDNVRELEGSLNRVTAYARLTRCRITVDVALAALNALAPLVNTTPPTPAAIIEGVARYFSLSSASLASASRGKLIAEARHIAMYLLREEAQLPLKTIGRLLGGRDHSTVIHACRRVSTSIRTTKGRRQLNEVQASLRSPR